jgi:hypothetical protein
MLCFFNQSIAFIYLGTTGFKGLIIFFSNGKKYFGDCVVDGTFFLAINIFVLSPLFRVSNPFLSRLATFGRSRVSTNGRELVVVFGLFCKSRSTTLCGRPTTATGGVGATVATVLAKASSSSTPYDDNDFLKKAEKCSRVNELKESWMFCLTGYCLFTMEKQPSIGLNQGE